MTPISTLAPIHVNQHGELHQGIIYRAGVAVEYRCPDCGETHPLNRHDYNKARGLYVGRFCAEKFGARECKDCHRVLPIEQFRPRAKAHQGLRCNDCNRERRALLLRQRMEQPGQPQVQAERVRVYARNNATRERERQRAMRLTDKGRARRRLRDAVYRGRIVKPDTCQECGGMGRIHGHHTDYTRALDVAWLCHPCHMKRHRKYVNPLTEQVANVGGLGYE